MGPPNEGAQCIGRTPIRRVTFRYQELQPRLWIDTLYSDTETRRVKHILLIIDIMRDLIY